VLIAGSQILPKFPIAESVRRISANITDEFGCVVLYDERLPSRLDSLLRGVNPCCVAFFLLLPSSRFHFMPGPGQLDRSNPRDRSRSIGQPSCRRNSCPSERRDRSSLRANLRPQWPIRVRAVAPRRLLCPRHCRGYSGANNVFLDPSSPVATYGISDNGVEHVATETATASLTSALSWRLISHLNHSTCSTD